MLRVYRGPRGAARCPRGARRSETAGALVTARVWLSCLCLGGLGSVAAAGPSLVLACRADNDLYLALQRSGVGAMRYDTPAEALAQAAEGAGVLLLADGYPARTTPFDAELARLAASRRLRVYVEYPAWLPDLPLGPPANASWSRAVVASDAFGAALPRQRIAMVQDCHYLPAQVVSAHLVLARVAGYDTAVFGLPAQSHPLLFEHHGLLVATTRLSSFVTGRYAPVAAWPPIWQMILGWLGAGQVDLRSEPLVRPSYPRDAALPEDAAAVAIRRGTDWYTQARLLLNAAGRAKMGALPQDVERLEPMPPAAQPVGDGSEGILEAFSSAIAADGTQPVRWYARADCCSEAAMALALRGRLDGHAPSSAVARRLLDFVDERSTISQGPRAAADSSSYGLLGWDDRPMGAVVYYGDDNARAILGQLGAAAALGDERWNQRLLRAMLANFRTTGPSGYRQARIEEHELVARGWRWFWDRSSGAWGNMRHSPHYQAYLWAVNLWLYDKARFEPLRERTVRGIGHLMNLPPEQWDCESNRHEAERVRMLLPLAWLVRIDNTPEHRRWLDQTLAYVLAAQDASGAIRGRVTASATANEQYGTGECALIHATGDPCTDLLYTTNFALLGLHEAVAATGDAAARVAEDRLADFLVRIQARSERRRELDGAWFRGFDYAKWDYWGSNGDIGWGVWSTETGWTQGWITGVLALRQLRTSLWDLTAASTIAREFDAERRAMMPDACFAEPVRLTHAARGAGVTLDSPPATQYSAAGPGSLTDGLIGEPDPASPEWLGYQGADLAATVDLGQPTPVRSAALRCLLHPRTGVFPPRRVRFLLSDDGRVFRAGASLDVPEPAAGARPEVVWLRAELTGTARYVRVEATNLGRIPAWQGIAPGAPAWLFVDELLINAPTEAPKEGAGNGR